MESFVQLRRGSTPDRIHADLGELKDDELGRNGFTGRQAQLFRRHDPTAFRSRGPVRELHAGTERLHPSDEHDPEGSPLLLLANADCRVSLSRRSSTMPFHQRNIDGDEVWFVHRGTGLLRTEFGPIPYRPGDYVYLPKACTYRHEPAAPGGLFLVLETYRELRVPSSPALGRHWPFDSTAAFIPQPDPEPAGPPAPGPFPVRLLHSGQVSWLDYEHDPCDVLGWQGDNFPFRINIDQYDVLMSDTVHLPPSVHVVLSNEDVFLLNFLPRRAEGRRGTERVPWYHRNVDFDEVAFYHGGSVFGVDLPAGLISHAPQGIHHGAPERARVRARRRHEQDDRVEWQIISIDTRQRLVPSAELRALADGEARS